MIFFIELAVSFVIIMVNTVQQGNNYIFYHSPCPDGELAAAIWRRENQDANFIPYQHHMKEDAIKILGTLPAGTQVVFLDVCPTIEDLNGSLNYLIIDHHKDAVEKLNSFLMEFHPTNITLVADTTKSGCQLTWEFCHPDTQMPKSVIHIGNKDIWNWNNPDTEPFTLGYPLFPNSAYPIERMEEILCWDDEKVGQAIEIGKTKITEFRAKAETYFSEYYSTELTDGTRTFNVLSLDCPEYPLYKYILEHAKTCKEYEGFDILRIVQEKDGKFCYSLRAIKNVTVDGVARHYGGNGHPKAAGYAVTIE